MQEVISALGIDAGRITGNSEVDSRLKDVHSVFVFGNNQAAEKIRSEMKNDSEKGKTCLAIVTNPDRADATLEVAAESSMIRGRSPMAREREWIINGTLTTKSGDMIWSAHSQFSDAPFTSGGDTAGKGLYRRLKLDVCGK